MISGFRRKVGEPGLVTNVTVVSKVKFVVGVYLWLSNKGCHN